MRQNKTHKYILFILFALYVLYFAQGSLYEQGTIVSQAALFLIYSISALYMIKSFFVKTKKTLFFKVWTLFLILNTIWFIFYPAETKGSGMYKGVLLTFISFYPFYYFSVKGILKDKHFIYFFIALLPINVLQFYFYSDLSFAERYLYEENITNNVAYSFAIIIPFVFLFKEKRLISFLSLFVLMFFIVQGAKRGAIIVGLVGFLLFTWYQLSLVSGRNRWRNYFIIGIGIAVLLYYAVDYYLQQEYLVNRMIAITEGNSSGRDILAIQVWKGWYHSDNLFHYIFGFGFAGSMKLTNGMFAHNDWLELLSNMGLVGVTTYLFFFFATLKYIFSPGWTKDKKILFSTIILMWFMTSLFSMGYMNTEGYLHSILLGFLVGEFDKIKLTLTR